jgi:HlyD family secretion protein
MAENQNRRKVLIFVAAALVVVIIAVLSMHKRAPLVQVVQVSRGNLSTDITSNGKVEPISPQVARALYPTFVKTVTATEGQSVHRGQLILTLDAADVQAQLAQAKADLLVAQTDLRNARAGGPPGEMAQLQGDWEAAKVEVDSLERNQKTLKNLVAEHAATQEELAQNQANLDKARANFQALDQRRSALKQQSSATAQSAALRVSQAQYQVAALAAKVRSATVTALVDGTLYSLPVRAGDYVKIGDVLAEMADLRRVRVRAFVDEPDLGALEPNQNVEVTWDAKPGHVWKGQTEQVPKQVVPRGMRSVGEVLCSVNNDKLELLPNVNAQVRILVRERQDVLTIPRAAVFENGDKHYVFVVQDNTIHRRDISVGINNASDYEVSSGLAEGNNVALPGDRVLRDGMEVRIAEAE